MEATISGSEPNIPPLPKKFAPIRSELRRTIYGTGFGIARDDLAGRRVAVLRNYGFCGAPLAGIVCMNHELFNADPLSVRTYLQTFSLVLTEGIDSCCQVSVAGYPEVIRKMTGIPEDMDIICGISIAFEDKEANFNQVRSRRLRVNETAIFPEGVTPLQGLQSMGRPVDL